MKKIIYSLFAIILIASSACKKDTVPVPAKTFDDITYQDILDLNPFEFPFEEIIISTQKGGDVLKPGSVILYNLLNGRIGKFKIVSFSAQNILTFDMITYDGITGDVVLDKKGATVMPNFVFNLQSGLQSPSIVFKGFYFDVIGTDLDRKLLPCFETRMYVYSK
jgi:hypothetical protein